MIPPQVADPVAVGVGEAARIDLIDDCGLPPHARHHDRRAPLRRRLALRLDRAGRGGRPRPLPRAVRPRLADHGAAAAAGAAGHRARHAARARRAPGRREHPGTLEEPGKIGHEFRDRAPDGFLEAGWPDDGPFAYYGTADATSWYLILAARLGVEAPEAAALARAGAGPRRRADPVGPGGVARAHAAGLARHRRPDARLRRRDPAPRRDRCPSRRSPTPTRRRSRTPRCGRPASDERAEALRARLSADFVPRRHGDRGRRPAGARRRAPSSAGCCGRTRSSRTRATPPPSGCARRTSSRTSACARCPASRRCSTRSAYHRGSVWPFDSWLGWGGLRRAGRPAEAERVRTGVLEALDRLGRAPELYAVSRAGEVEPVPALQPGPGLDGGGALGARERVGRPQPALTTTSCRPASAWHRDLEPAVGLPRAVVGAAAVERDAADGRAERQRLADLQPPGRHVPGIDGRRVAVTRARGAHQVQPRRRRAGCPRRRSAPRTAAAARRSGGRGRGPAARRAAGARPATRCRSCPTPA